MASDTEKNIKLTIKIPDEDIFILHASLRSYIETTKKTLSIYGGKVPKWVVEEQLRIDKLMKNILDEIEAYVRK